MKLSIIVPIYNVEDYLDECISSLYLQELALDDFEVLLIDDGSMDSSLAIANKWAGIHYNIRVFHQENKGQAAARNLGLDNARGRNIMFVDSDDFILPKKLSGLLSQIQKNGLDALIYNLKVQRSDGTAVTLSVPGVRYNHVYSGEEVVLKYFVFGSMCRGIFSRSVFDDNGLRFKSGFTHEDSELCFRLYPLLKKIVFNDAEVYFYRYNIQSTDRSKAIEKIRRNIESDAILVSEIKKNIGNHLYSGAIERRYTKILNSIMTTLFIRVKSCGIWNKDEFDDKIKQLEELGVYPIKGLTCSWRSFLFSKLYNRKFFLRLFLYGYK
ncbi:glycosyltransferase family 2 protein [Muribaculum intestinale]|uniref:glycosyltransferase family 2 protein n=1 Tax=Muribaculum intestinale TaxID=1796646 RepID=UPI0025AA0503|nr:glycosyltransferase [Muribaculum intestinale]